MIRLTNMIVSPGEVFDEVRAVARDNSNWVAPLALSMIAGFAYIMVMYSQPQILQQIHEAQQQSIQKMVDQGKITQQMADQQLEIAGKFTTGTVLKIFGILSILIMTPCMFFFMGLIVWLLGVKLFKGEFHYMKAVEAVGLCQVISILSMVVRTLLTVIYGDAGMTLGPILFVGHFDRHNPLHVFLSTCNVLDIWWLIVMALGLSKLSGAGFLKCALWGFGLWLFLLVLPGAALARWFGGK
jgi:hypothetical protein